MSKERFTTRVGEWRKLLAAAREHELELPQLGPFAAALEEALEDLVIARARQRSLKAKSVQATGEVNDELSCVQEAVSKLQSFVRALCGRKDERLAAFGVKALGRSRGSRKARKGGTPGYTH